MAKIAGSFVTTVGRRIVRGLPWRRPDRTTVAVEWSGEWLKVAQVTAGRAGKRLVRLEAREIPSPDALPGLIHDLVAPQDEQAEPPDAVFMALPRNLVTVRNLRLPSTDPAELKDMVDLQAATLTPYAKDEIVAGFHTIASQTGERSSEGSTDVVLAIVNQEASHARLGVLGDAQLKARGIRLSSQGLVEWYTMAPGPGHEGTGRVAVVDIHTTFTDFVVVADRQLLFTKMLPIGVAKLLGGQQAWLSQFEEEMKTALDLYEHEGVGGPVAKAVITGAEVEVEGFETRLHERFGLAVEWVPVLERVPDAQEVLGDSAAARKSTSCAAVIGLAWNPDGTSIDLTPQDVGLQEGLVRRGRDLAIAGILCLSLLMVLSGFISARLYIKRQYLDQLRQEVQRTRGQAEEVEKLRHGIRTVHDLMNARGLSLETLSLLHQLLPPEIYLTAVTFKVGDQLTLKGVAGEMSHVFEFVSVLEKRPEFVQVKVRQIATKTGEGEKRLAEFEIACTLKRHDETQAVVF